MTSTGSSLIVNPRTISKELEAKIAAAIAGVIASHDVAKLTTKLVRQAVEKEVHVSLASHKDVLKRLMHQELRKLKAKKLAKRAAPEPWKIAMRRESVVKGLTRVYQMLREAAAFPAWGLHAMQSLYDLQAVEDGDVLRLATLYARLIGALWLKQDRHADWAVGTVPTPTQLVDAIAAVYLVERVGICHSRRVELLDFCDRSPAVYGPKLLGWNPAEGPPPADESGPSIYERLTSALVLWHHSNALGISIGFTLPQLLQHLLAVYPYKGPGDLSPQQYEDQAHLVTTLVFVLTNHGKLRCETVRRSNYFHMTEGSKATSSPSHSSSDATVDSEVAGATAGAPSESEDVATRVAFLQGLLDQNGNVKNVSAALATHVLKTLGDMVLTVDILKSTGVGRTINKLRKHATPSVAKSATQLVAKWKKDLL
ncbi:unnamed protein product [Phytophthora lilii]|uniref:Unnamed protein product n=1 Tax=Phytophthora lilii TaxID=2077276 RepID=A0A9W6TBK5_9STRA|nr:unnamed protein product [Phytophthora lilii]